MNRISGMKSYYFCIQNEYGSGKKVSDLVVNNYFTIFTYKIKTLTWRKI